MRHDFTPDLAVWEGPALNSKNSLGTSPILYFHKELKLKQKFKHIFINNINKYLYISFQIN